MPKLRALLGTSRLSMPDADGAYAATGYLRGTITPFGSSHRWPVIADVSIAGRTISMGAGAHGVAVTVAGDDVIAALAAQVADVIAALAAQVADVGDVADVADVADKADVADPA